MTPKPLFEDGFSVYFFSNENNESPHVHVSKGDGNAKWWLTPEPREQYCYGFNSRERKRIKVLINKYHGQLLQAWQDHFKQK